MRNGGEQGKKKDEENKIKRRVIYGRRQVKWLLSCLKKYGNGIRPKQSEWWILLLT